MSTVNKTAAAGPEWPSGVRHWFEDRCVASQYTITRVSLDAMRGWGFHEMTGNLVHESGKFFSVEGLDVRVNGGPVRHWQQPIIRQPEIGILGILVKRIGGRVHCLMQAKMEPGNVNGVQLSPTVQATKSNYTRVHGGQTTRYLDYFVHPARGRVVVDVLQSEQGAWFLGKRNRNMVVDVGDDEPPPHEDYCWISLEDLSRLFQVDNLINMDARTVLSCLAAANHPGSAQVDGDGFAGALARSFTASAGHSDVEVLSWFTERKSFYEVTVRRMSLAAMDHWKCSANTIEHDEGRHFGFVGLEIRASNREVSHWCQPMLVPTGRGVVAFMTRRFGGVLYVLVQALVQPGLPDVVEMGPTVQCRPENYAHLANRPMFLDAVLSASPERLRYDSLLSEEGGRFYHAENRYLVVEANDDIPDDPPPDFHWATPGQLASLLRHGNYINVEARTLLGCLGMLRYSERHPATFSR